MRSRRISLNELQLQITLSRNKGMDCLRSSSRRSRRTGSRLHLVSCKVASRCEAHTMRAATWEALGAHLAVEVVEVAIACLLAQRPVALVEQVLFASELVFSRRGHPVLPDAVRQAGGDVAAVAASAAALAHHAPLLVMVGGQWRRQVLHWPSLCDADEGLQRPLHDRQRRLLDVGVLVGRQRPRLALLPPLLLLFLLLDGPWRWIWRPWRPRRGRVGRPRPRVAFQHRTLHVCNPSFGSKTCTNVTMCGACATSQCSDALWDFLQLWWNPRELNVGAEDLHLKFLRYVIPSPFEELHVLCFRGWGGCGMSIICSKNQSCEGRRKGSLVLSSLVVLYIPSLRISRVQATCVCVATHDACLGVFECFLLSYFVDFLRVLHCKCLWRLLGVLWYP